MSKTFGQLKAGDEVYVINGSKVEIVKVQITRATSIQGGVFMTIKDMDYILPINKSSFSICLSEEFYCNIDDAIKTMKERCENALQNYKRASGSLNLLESFHKITKKEHKQMLAQVAQSEILRETKKKEI